MYVIQQNESSGLLRRIYFYLAAEEDGDPITGAAESVTVRVVKNGTDAAGSGSVGEVDGSDVPGLYFYEATQGECDTLGSLIVVPSAPGAFTFRYPVTIVEYSPFEAPDDASDVASSVLSGLGTGDGLTSLASASALSTVSSNLSGLISDIGSNGSGLTAIPWNSAWDAEVQSECADALSAYDPPTKSELDAAVAPLATASGLSTVEGKIDTIDNIVDAILVDTDTTIPGLLSTIDGNVDSILADTGTTVSGLSTVEGKIDTIDNIVDEILVDTGTSIPAQIGGLSFPTASDIADAVWDEAQVDHVSAGTFGSYLDSSVSGVSTGGVSVSDIADAVWDEALSGHTSEGSAGALLGAAGSGADAETIADAVRSELATELARLDAAVSTRATSTDISTALSNLNDLSQADVQAALDAQGLTSAVVTALHVAALLSAGDWTRSDDVITLADGTQLELTVDENGVVTELKVTPAE